MRSFLKNLLKMREVNLLGLIIVLMVLVTIRAPHFIQLGNLNDILKDTSILIMVGIAQLMVILTGGIDLSVASTMALTGMSVSLLNMNFPGLPVWLILILAAVIGLVLGSFNGLLVSIGKIPPIIATLGTISIYRGFVFVLSGGQWVSAHEMTAAFKAIPNTTILGLDSVIWYMFLVVIVFSIFLNYTRKGREIYAVGGNKTATEYVGISAGRVNFRVFALCGMIAGFAGLMYVSQYAIAQNETAVGFELRAIAACVIGGVSIAGGSGNVPGVILGAIFLGIVNNALTVANFSPFYQMAIQGFVILAAIITNTLMDRRNQLAMLKKRSL